MFITSNDNDCDDVDAGWITDRCPRWSTTDPVPVRSSGDIQEDPGAGGWRALPAASIRHPHHSPQPGDDDSTTKTSLQCVVITRLSRVRHLSLITHLSAPLI